MTNAGAQLEQTLILRLWREGTGATTVWRCSVEDPRTKQRRGFSSLAELFPFLDLLTRGFESASLLDASEKTTTETKTQVPRA
ncbi:MAG: hypothetical protein ACHQQS_09230 [Thermoanaerobaculales bacterium]